MNRLGPSNTAARARGRIVVDQRRYRRAPLEVPVLLDTGASHVCGRTVDVSPDGILITLPVSFSQAVDVELYFELPTGIAIEARAQVVRTQETEVALRFIRLSSEAALGLRGFCRLSGIVAKAG